MRGPLGEPWRAWLGLAVGVLAVSAQQATSLTTSVLMKPITEQFGWSRSQFALAATVRLLALTCMMPFAGSLADRLGARAVLGWGALAVGAVVLSMSQMQDLTTYMGLSLLMGPAQACIGALAASTLVLRLFHRQRGLAVGILNGGDNLLSAMVPVAAAAVLSAFGWRIALVVLGVGFFALGGAILAVLREDEGRAASRGEWGDLPWRDARLWVVCLVYAAIYAYVTSVQLHFHAFQTDGGRSAAVASQLLGLQIFVGAAGAPLAGWLAQRTSARTALVVVVGGLVVSAAVISRAERVSVLYAWAVWHGLINSGVVALLALVLHECFGPERLGRLLGVAMVFCMSATLAGNQWSAWVFDSAGSYVGAWQLYAALLLLALGPVAWLRRAPASAAA